MKSFLEENNLIEPIEMTLRDYFAAQAMPMVFKFVQNAITEDGENFEIEDNQRENNISSDMVVVAEYCYILADAMMEAKNDS
jgi:hypothetical protein